MEKVGWALGWWRGARRRRPVLFGGIFWGVFWSVSAAAMIWVYSPGGLGDPDRDLRTPERGIGKPVCIKDCPAEEQPVAAPEESTRSTRVRARRSPTPTTEPTDKVPITLPPVPTVKLPDVSIVVDEVMNLAGNRYLHYRIGVVAEEALGDIAVTANVPEQAWLTDCSDQAGQPVCVDSYRGTGDTHQMFFSTAISRPMTKTFAFWVHLDPTTDVDTDVSNHAHATIDSMVVTSRPHVYTVPPMVGS